MGQTAAHIVHPTPVVLDFNKGPRREPTRPREFQVDNFAQEFDDSTLFFDAFFDSDGKSVGFVAPAFLNLAPYVSEMTITAFPAEKQCTIRIKNMDRHSQVWAEVPRQTARLRIESGLGRFDIVPNRNISDWFAGKRVLLTLSKNNPLTWVTDWVRYHRDVHGANAVLFYDNASSAYTPAQLLDALAAISGIECACVIVWPFKYGPQGLAGNRYWDSDFCQSGVLEHARWIALQKARSVLNSDIDELVVSSGNSSVFEAAERSWLGNVRFAGVWVYPVEGAPPRPGSQVLPRFADFDHYVHPRIRKKFGLLTVIEGGCGTKWAVVPSRCPEKAQWTAHRIKNWFAGIPKSKKFAFRHYREINTNWKYTRSGPPDFPFERYEYDKLAVSALSRVNWKA